MPTRQWKLKSARMVLAVTIGLFVVAGCSSEATQSLDAVATSAPAAVASSETSETSETSEVAETAADAALPGPVFETVSGGQFDLNSLEGTDTVLWFWAPW